MKYRLKFGSIFLLMIGVISLPAIAAPQRIISLSPATTEMVYALGAGPQLVGVTTNCDYPPAARKKTRVASATAVDLEKLVSLKPDLIIAPADLGMILKSVERLKIPTLTLKSPDLPSIIGNFTILGDRLQKKKEAAKLVKSLKDRLARSRQQTQRKSVTGFYIVWPDPLMTAASNSFIGDILMTAGIRNIVSRMASPYPLFSLETLLIKQPEVVIVPTSLENQVRWEAAPWRSLQAVKANRRIVIEDDLISRPGPRAFDAVDFLQKNL